VTETVSFVIPLVGEILVTVAAVALETVNECDTVPLSEFRTTRVHVPVVTPFRLKFRLIEVAVSVPVSVPVMVDSPLLVRVTAVPLVPKFVPVITIVCHPPLVALDGERLVIVGVEVYVYPPDAVPSSVVIITLTAPAAWAGVVAVIVVAEETVYDAAAVPPKVTPVTLTKPVPVIVTDVPPATVPDAGEMLENTGAAATGTTRNARASTIAPARKMRSRCIMVITRNRWLYPIRDQVMRFGVR